MYIHIQQKIKKITWNSNCWWVQKTGVRGCLLPIAISKHLLHSPSKYTDLDQQIKTAAANGKATHCQQASFRHRKCIHTVKPHWEDSAPGKQPSAAGSAQLLGPFLSIILTKNMFLSDVSSEETRSQEGRGGMSTSGKMPSFQGHGNVTHHHTRRDRLSPSQTTAPEE